MLPIADSTMNSELSFEIYKEAIDKGLVIRYDTITYREQEVNFVSDPSGHQCFAQWKGNLVDLGLDNIYYKEDVCKLIDYTLDFIADFRNSPNFVGAKLEYFNNGGYRDIRLLYKGRTVKVFLVAGEVNETFLISQAQLLLVESGLLEE